MSNSGPNDRKRQREIEQQSSYEMETYDSIHTYVLGIPLLWKDAPTTFLHDKVRSATAAEVQNIFFSPHKIDSIFSFFNGRSVEELRKARFQLFINLKDADGNTPLHIAASLGKSEMATLLVLNGADTKLRNRNRETAGEIAHLKGHAAMALALGFVATADYISSAAKVAAVDAINAFFNIFSPDFTLSSPSADETDNNPAKKPRNR